MHPTIKPLVTEKTFKTASKGWYAFAVSLGVDKPEVASVLHAEYGVDVIKVRSVSMHGKFRRAGKRQAKVKKMDWKKMLVQLKAGQKFDFFESAQPSTEGAK